MCMGCMEGVLSGSMGWDIRKMAAQLMEWSGAALMGCGGKSGGGEKEGRKACEGSQATGGRKEEGEEIQEGVVSEADGLEQSRQRSLGTLLIVDFFCYVSD